MHITTSAPICERVCPCIVCHAAAIHMPHCVYLINALPLAEVYSIYCIHILYIYTTKTTTFLRPNQRMPCLFCLSGDFLLARMGLSSSFGFGNRFPCSAFSFFSGFITYFLHFPNIKLSLHDYRTIISKILLKALQ